MASAALLTMIFVNKYVFHQPLYRILQQIKQMGMNLPSSTLDSWVKLVAELLVPLFEVHRLHVFRESYQMIDESPIKVQDKDLKGACHLGYLWVRYAPLSKSVLFEYYPSRSAKGPIADLNSREITATMVVLREPQRAVIDRDGKYLFVVNFLPNQASDSDNVCASISVIDLNGFIRIKEILLPNGSSALRGITLSPDGKFLLATHNLGRYALPTNQLLQRWMSSNAMSLMFIMLGFE
jgi:hypothetical protein